LTIAGVLLALTGAALAVVGVLGLRRRLPRNRIAGIRTPATLRDDEAFAVGNRVGGPLVLVAGAITVLGSASALGAPTATTGWVLVALAAVGCLGLTLTGGVLGDRAAALVPAPEPTGCSGVCAGCSLVAGCGGQSADTDPAPSAGSG
jgi:hypothetical protein